MSGLSLRIIGFIALIGYAGFSGFAEDSPRVVANHQPEPADADGLSLEECIAIAVSAHPKLGEVNARIDQSRGDAFQAGLYPNPRLDSGNPQVLGQSPSSVYSVGVMQEIVVAGKLKLNRAAAQETVRQTEWDQQRLRFEVITAVRQGFFSTLAAQQRLVIVDSLLKVARDSEAAGTKLWKGGQVSETDVLLLRVERRRAETAFQNARTNWNGRLKQLSATLGQPQLRIDRVRGDLSMPLPDFDDHFVLMSVAENSPLVQMAKIDINRAFILLRRAEVEPIPNVTIQGGYQYSQNTPHPQALVGVYVDVPLWNRNQGGIAAAGAAIRRSVAQKEVTISELTRQLADALARFRSATQAVQSYEDGILPDARRTLTLIQQAYALGQFDITRLLQTQRSLFEVNLGYVAEQESRLNAAADIAGLLQLEDLTTPDMLPQPAPEAKE